MAIGRPIELTPNITSKNISVVATEGQTEFTVTGGYRINEIGVYRNGVRLVDGRDFSATDGQTVTFISDTVVVDDIVEFSILDSFDIAGTIVSAASTQTLNGNLHVTESLFAGTFNPTNIVSTAATFNSTFHVGSALTANAAGDVESIGIITAASFSGDGSALTGLANTDFIVSVATTTANLIVSAAATVTGALSGSTGTFSGAVNVDATTDSTSTSTGALIVDGGVGIAKNVYIGAGLSVAGTLTYEDVTSVDSVGLITAKSGVNITGGQLQVGTAYSVGNAGVVTAQNVTISAGTIDLKNSGSVSNIKFYCESSNAHYTALQSAAHSAYAGNVTLTLPTTTDTLVARTTTDTLTNKTLTSPTLTTPSFSGAVTGEFKVGTALTIGSAGLTTFAGDVDFSGVTASMVWDRSDDALEFADNVEANWGSSSDLKIYHSSSNAASYIQNSQGNLFIEAPNSSAVKLRKNGTAETMFVATAGGSCELYEDNTKRLETTTYGAKVTGIGSFTTSVYLNTNGTYLAENVISFEPSGIAYIDHRTVGQNITFRMSSGSALDTNAIIVGATGITTFSDTPHDDLGSLRDIPLRSVTGSAATLVVGDAGKVVSTNTTGWTVPASTFSEGDTVTLLNNSAGGLTITCSAVTTYLTSDGSTVTSKTLGARGLATLYFVSASVAYLQGTSLS